ncbi:hypothetical protein [Pedococcus sp. 5OH_020]|uniref:hypothetical protein n=1 Tax=Pedococcus sp. 5OH_020 TaxID=2989814 RepID=UPI0022E9A121|nr:hypothetical protein [Pedococcus sp. 5OH_020]
MVTVGTLALMPSAMAVASLAAAGVVVLEDELGDQGDADDLDDEVEADELELEVDGPVDEALFWPPPQPVRTTTATDAVTMVVRVPFRMRMPRNVHALPDIRGRMVQHRTNGLIPVAHVGFQDGPRALGLLN